MSNRAAPAVRARFPAIRLREGGIVSIEIARAIKEAIADGRFAPGDRLPAERDFARLLKVSRTSLRDGLKLLVGMGLIRVKRNRGIFIAAPDDPEVAIAHVSNYLLLQRGPLADLFEIRRVLESAASGWATERASEAQLAALEVIYGEFAAKAALGKLSPEEANQYDEKIHLLIAEAAGNEVVVEVIANLRRVLEQIRAYRDVLSPQRVAENVADLGVLIGSLRRRDVEGARKAMLDHLTKGEAANLGTSSGSSRAEDNAGSTRCSAVDGVERSPE